jgi:hypothetical protein
LGVSQALRAASFKSSSLTHDVVAVEYACPLADTIIAARSAMLACSMFLTAVAPEGVQRPNRELGLLPGLVPRFAKIPDRLSIETKNET